MGGQGGKGGQGEEGGEEGEGEHEHGSCSGVKDAEGALEAAKPSPAEAAPR